MPPWILSFLLVLPTIGFIQAGEESRLQYLELAESSPLFINNEGNYRQGEIEIVLEPGEMERIEQATGREVGVVMRDRYWLWVNDPCRFPNGTSGVYGRILWAKSLEGVPGVAVMPITSEGKVALNCNFRHATRSWEIELPRGCVNKGEEPETAAKRETLEETGMQVGNLRLLGEMATDTGVTNTVVPIYLAHIAGIETPQPEDSEAIEEVLFLTIAEIKQAFRQGYYEHPIRGTIKRIPFRDPFLAYALLLLELN